MYESDIRLMECMVGKVFNRVYSTDDELVFKGDELLYRFYHSQDCCESVWIDEIHGDLSDLENTPLLVVEHVSNYDQESRNDYDESYTWTFYKFATIKGYVTVKFYGTSNGYYSEEVSIQRIDPRSEMWDTLKGH